MFNKKRLLFFILLFLLLLSLISAWYLWNQNSSQRVPNNSNIVGGVLPCDSYEPDSCPQNCVVCPPCPECSSLSCQSEDFCAKIGIDKSWYEKIKEGLSGVCARENYHGLDIRCGDNPPDVYTEMYVLGDQCLQYAKCGFVDGNCQLIENEQFDNCRLCVDNCSLKYKSDTAGAFECGMACQ